MIPLPEDWTETQMADIARCQGGCAFSPTLQGKKTGQVPFFKVSDMNLSDNKWVMRNANNYINDGDREYINGAEKPAGSVIFPKVGATIFTNKKRLLIQPAFVDNNVMAVWSTDVKRCIPAFLYLHFLTVPLSDLSNPGPLPSINNSKIYERTINLPPLSEQARIAAVIWKLQRSIEVQEKLIASARQLKQSAMKQLFTHGLRGESQKQTEIGPLPESWERVPLGQHLTQAQYGLSIRGHESGRVPILRMNCQVDGEVIFRDLQYVDVDDKILTAFRVNDGDLLFNRTNSHELVGRTAVFRSEREAVFASYLIRLALDPKRFHPEFLNYYLNQPSVQADLKRLASRGVSQSNINASKLRDYPVPITSLEEQRELTGILQVIDRKISVHERKRATLQELFKALLHQLMTGKIRVNELNIDTSEVTETDGAIGEKPTKRRS